jgi:hypothetical protein
MAKALQFIIVPTIKNHPWFYEVHKSAHAHVNLMGRKIGIEISLEFMAATVCDVAEQNTIFDQIRRLQATGALIDFDAIQEWIIESS